VTEDVWSERDTTPDAIDDALRRMLHELHAADGTLAPARVLNLVVVVDHDWKGEIANRLARVGRYHASRTVLCAVEEGRTTLDGRAVMRWDDPNDGVGVIQEQIEIDLGPTRLRALESVVDPVIRAELPTLLWCPHGHLDAVRSLHDLIDVVLIDSDDEPDAADGLARASELLEAAYVVDLAWLRTTPWRERLAASFDPPDRRERLERISALTVRHQPSSPASALLLAGWLCARLGWEPAALAASAGGNGGATALRGRAGSVDVSLEASEQESPGLAGVTVEFQRGFSLSLDRARGGLCARQHDVDGTERTWQVLGASRGEGGILGEGVRQAMLRDPTYGPALARARVMSAT
jgi:glucose-6-phosphate dehydrogenase assembly protein OpcA